MFNYTALVNFLARIVSTAARVNLVLRKIKLIKDSNSHELKESSRLQKELIKKAKPLQKNVNDLQKLLLKAAGVTFVSLLIIFGAIILWFVIK